MGAANDNGGGTPPGTLEGMIWHPARLSNLQLRVWLLVASGVQDVGIMASLAGGHRGSVSRALTSLADKGLLHRPDGQGRSQGRFEPYSYEVCNEVLDGHSGPR